MSQENVGIVRRAHEALNAGNLDDLVTLCHPDFQLDMSDRVLNPATYQGHDGIRQFYSEVKDVWEHYVWEPEELLTRETSSWPCCELKAEDEEVALISSARRR